MQTMDERSVDLILCDPPYGTTDCKWDTVIPFDQLWSAYRRVLKPYGVVVLFGAVPFTATMIVSNLREFSHAWYWKKNTCTGHLNAKRQPLRCVEDIAVFVLNKSGKKPPRVSSLHTYSTYNPQGLIPCHRERKGGRKLELWRDASKPSVQRFTNYPRQVLEFDNEFGLHPTQKPVPLLEYLIKTYSNPGELVLDNCMGSGSTGVACANTGRRFIGIEMDDTYFSKASERISDAFSCHAR